MGNRKRGLIKATRMSFPPKQGQDEANDVPASLSAGLKKGGYPPQPLADYT
jgi:hypothetical protein